MSLRVLHVISGDLWAGAETQAYTLISALTKLPATTVAVALMNDGVLAQKMRLAQIPGVVLDEQSLRPVQICARLRTFMRSWNPDVVHTHRTKENILGSLANRFAHYVPSVRTVHGGDENRSRQFGRRARQEIIGHLDRWCARHLQQKIIAVSRELRARIAQYFPEDRIVVIENGVDSDQLLADAKPADFQVNSPNSIHVGIVGRLVTVKRIDLFLHAAALLLHQQVDRSLQFHVIGEGPLLAELRDLSHELGIQAYVTFHGHRSDIAACVSSLDVVVMCSDHEGMPMTALETAALAVPLVGHAVGGLTEIVPREFLVVDHSARGYSQGMTRALASDARAISMKKSKQVLEEHSAMKNALETRALYEQLQAER